MRYAFLPLIVGWATAAASLAAATNPLPEFDFTRPEVVRQWGGPHHLSSLEATAEGLRVTLAGNDPYFFGPARDYPPGQALWVRLRLKSSQGGMAQLFYFDKHPTEERSRRFDVPKGEWTEVRLPLPALGPGYRLRLDPPGDQGEAVIAWVRFEPRSEFTFGDYPWPRPSPATRRVLQSGKVAWWIAPAGGWGGELRVDGQRCAHAPGEMRISYVQGARQVWMTVPPPEVLVERQTLRLERRWTDERGAAWLYRQVLRPGATGVIEIETTLETAQETDVLFAPMFLLAAGEGTNKNQALFAGLEYLENEPSSSEADIIGPEARRQVPANHKMTFPLMAVQEQGRYVALTYDQHLAFSAVFDSPDRLLKSGGHLMGVLWPESDGANRLEGSLLPHYPRTLKAGQAVSCRLRLLGGRGDTVVPAVQHYVALQGLPKYHKDYLDLSGYVELAAQGWLQSKIREGNRYRHAVWPGFNAQPAADAAMYQTWLATLATPSRSNALQQAATEALASVAPGQYWHSAISHVRSAAPPLVFGQVGQSVAAARQAAENALKRLGPEAIIRYAPTPGQTDYGRTYWTNHANGLTFQPLVEALRGAAFCGDPELVSRAVAALRAQDRYRLGVPRGAQTWEIPLHTPDILAAAHLVNAYVLGYELTGDPAFLSEARYWAWTGIPFVYLVNPTGQEVGIYGTIAVLGATGWRAPVWFGQPVQWCGLVYADALYRLAAVDPEGIWRTVAEGITVSGMQQTWKADDPDRVGLLPDYYLLHSQRSDGPAINPGTLGANAVNYFTQKPLHDFRCLRPAGIYVHAPGRIRVAEVGSRSARFQVHGWPAQPYYILLSHLAAQPQIRVNGQPLALQPPHALDAAAGWVALQLSGNPTLEVRLP